MAAQTFIVRTDNTDMSAADLLLDIVDSGTPTSARIRRDEVTVELLDEDPRTTRSDSILPWRVIREGSTVAAVENATKAVAVLEALADDDLTLWRLEFHMSAV